MLYTLGAYRGKLIEECGPLYFYLGDLCWKPCGVIFPGNFIDTANKYQEGQTERWLGEFIQKRGKRDDLVIATKYSLPMPSGSVALCGNSKKNMMQAVLKSLERLQTHYIDLLYGKLSCQLSI